MDIYKFSLIPKEADNEALINIDFTNCKRKKKFQSKDYDKVRNRRKGRLFGYG